MSSLLYFLPGEPGIRSDGPCLERRGLLELFRGLKAAAVRCQGPEGAGEGLLVADSREEACGLLRPDPAAQRWAKRLDGLAWTGYWAAERPAPEELARPGGVGGHPVVLGDRQTWLVPVARLWPEGTMLPESLAMGPDGQLARQILPEWQDLWLDALRLWEAGGLLPEAECFRIAARALSVNYRVGLDECNLLGLLTSQNLPAVCGALMDTPAIDAWREAQASKKAQAGADRPGSPGASSSSSGPADSGPVTPPASPICAGSKAAVEGGG